MNPVVWPFHNAQRKDKDSKQHACCVVSGLTAPIESIGNVGLQKCPPRPDTVFVFTNKQKRIQ